MENEIKDSKRIITFIRFHSLIYGIILLVFGFIGVYGFYYSITNFDYRYPTNLLINQLVLIIPFISSGLLLIITYFGLSHSKIYAKITGVLACSIILIILIAESPSFYIYSGYFWLSILLLLILFVPSVVLFVLIAIFWKKIPSYNKIQVTKKTKMMVLSIIVIAIIVSTLSYLFLYINNINDKSKFIGTWELIEAEPPLYFENHSLFSTYSYYENNSLKIEIINSSTEEILFTGWEIYKIEFGKLYIKQNENVLTEPVTYSFSNNDKTLKLSYSGSYTVYSKIS